MTEYFLGFVLISCAIVGLLILHLESKKHKAKMAAFEKEWEMLTKKSSGADHE